MKELNLVEFLFSCCGCVSRVVWEKKGLRVRSRCLIFFANKWLCVVLENDFWDGWNLNFSVDYDRAKCQKRVGENGIKIRLTVWILCVKWWRRKNGKKLYYQSSTALCVHGTGRVYTLPFLARAVRAVRTSVFSFFVLFHPFLFWIGLWCKHESSK